MNENDISDTVALWRDVVTKLGLSPDDEQQRQPDAEFFVGVRGDKRIAVKLQLESSGRVSVACSVGCSTSFRQALEIRPIAFSFQPIAAIQLGDPAFDEVVAVSGDEILVRALLEVDVRNLLLPLFNEWGIVILDGCLHLTPVHSSRIERAETAIEVIEQMLAAINRLNTSVLRYSGTPTPAIRNCLATIAESDPCDTVRFRSYVLLERTTGQYAAKLLELAEKLTEEHAEYLWPLMTQAKSSKVRAWALDRCVELEPTKASLTRLFDAFESSDQSGRCQLLNLLKGKLPSKPWAWEQWLRLVRLGKSPNEHKLIWELVDGRSPNDAAELTPLVVALVRSNNPAVRFRALAWLGHVLPLEEFWRLLGSDLKRHELTEKLFVSLRDEKGDRSSFFYPFMRLAPEQRWRVSSLLREINTDWATFGLAQTIPANNQQIQAFPEYGQHQISQTLTTLKERGKRGVGESRLIGLLKSSHTRFSTEAARTLGSVGTRQSLGPLEDIATALFGSAERKAVARASLEKLRSVFAGEPGSLSLSSPSGSGELSMPDEDGALSLEEGE